MDGLNKFIYEIGSDSAFSILARSNELLKQGKEVINLGIGQPDFPTSDHIVESAIKALREERRKINNEIITNLPKFESDYEVLHKKYYAV